MLALRQQTWALAGNTLTRPEAGGISAKLLTALHMNLVSPNAGVQGQGSQGA